jgi:sugar phosphate isomerase/epimerase
MTKRKDSTVDDSHDNGAQPDRREFLGTLGALLASTALPMNSVGSVLSAMKVGPIGLQLYTVRDEMKKDVAGTLARVARIGYREVEFAGYFDKSPQSIRAMLKRNGLTAPSAHIGFPVLGASFDKIIADALVVGHQYLICPWIDEKQRTIDGYKAAAELFNKAGERAKQSGLKFGYHNHNFEFPLVDGQRPYDLLITQTDPDKVVMEMDVFWVRKGGADPLEYFKKYPGRFQELHIKDMDATPDQNMTDVGKGIINWKEILSHRAQAGTKHIFVEHDQPKDPYVTIRNSYQYLRTLAV